MKLLILYIVAMNAKSNRLHLEIQCHRSNPVGLIRSSFRKDGKVKHTTHGRITGRSLEQLRLIQAAFQGQVVPEASAQALQIISGKEYGASYVGLALAKELGLDRLIYSRHEPWVRDSLALVVGRLVYAGSELALSHIGTQSALWELSGLKGPVDVDRHCYAVLDRLLARQPAIQRGLAAKHLKSGHLIFYDLTSSYFEGDYSQSDIVCFGHNRDGKKGHEQMVIGLMCNELGCPVGIEVFRGNTQDATTVLPKIKQIQQDYKVQEVIFVGDRGLVTQANAKKLEDVDGLHTISALTHRQIVKLLERQLIQPELFDQKQIVQVYDPDQPNRRYCLCKNPNTAQKETQTRQSLLGRTTEALNRIAQAKRRSKVERISARVGKVLQKYKMGKFVVWEVKDGRLEWHWDEGAIAAEAVFDGCYIVTTDLPESQMTKEDVVKSYKKLSLVEKAFRLLKTVWLEIRPVFHKTDDRIRAHAFVCMLGYYLQWHMQQRLEPLFASDGRGKRRRWTFQAVMQCLQRITRNRVRIGKVEFQQVTTPDLEQQKVLDLLGVRL
jgi:hypothetical protein